MSLFDLLSPTETIVAEQVTRGLSEKEIASEMFISPNTVHNHTYSIRRKWKCRSAVDIARKFILSLENPKKFFVALLFIGIQTFAATIQDDIVMKRASKRNRIIYKTSRKIS